MPFQSGRVGGRRPGAADPAALAPWVGPLTWEDLGRAALTKPKSEAREDEEITDLKVLVDAVRDANRALGIPAQHSPWLPALDETLLLDDVEVPSYAPAPGTLPPAPFGVEDLPSDQARRPVVVDFSSFGHLMIGGARAAAGRRCCAPSRARWPAPTPWRTSTCTASTAVTARSTR